MFSDSFEIVLSPELLCQVQGCRFCPKDFDEGLVHLDKSGRLHRNSGMRKYYTTESEESSVAICKCRIVLNSPFHGHSINMKEYPYDC